LAKNRECIIDLEATLATSAGHPVGNKAIMQYMIKATLSDMIKSSIGKCIADISANLLIYSAKSNERWNALLPLKQEEKIAIEKK
jgi:hypothetical protein